MTKIYTLIANDCLWKLMLVRILYSLHFLLSLIYYSIDSQLLMFPCDPYFMNKETYAILTFTCSIYRFYFGYLITTFKKSCCKNIATLWTL